MLVNFTNHPSAQWGEAQLTAARRWGAVVDLPFPEVDPAADEASLDAIAGLYAGRILAMAPDAVLCQGECTLAYRITRRLLEQGVPVVAACTRRRSVEQPQPDGTTLKRSVFAFTRFRQYDTS